MHILGIIFALIALLAWGFGDFFIQRTSRDFGIWPSLFCITGAGSIVLTPFVVSKLPTIFDTPHFLFLLLVGVISLAVALLQFEALKIGKIAIIEPIMSFELPLVVLLSVVLIHENISGIQGALIALVFGGILLVGYSKHIKAHHLFEKGALLALAATFVMAFVNFTTGIASQSVGPVLTIWFVHTFIALACVLYFTITKNWTDFFRHVHQFPKESIAVSILDNSAWLAYSTAVLFIPISLTVTISESYIILAVLLGVMVNRERLLLRQWIGVGIAIISVIALAGIS